MKQYKYRKDITIDGIRYTVRANTQEELGRKIERRIQSAKEKKAKESTRTVEDWALSCIELYKTGQSEITRKKYVARIRHCILEEIGAMQVRAVSPERCQMVMNQQAGNSATQVNEVYQAMRFIFSRARIAGLISEDPTVALVKPKKGKSHPRRALTDEERQTFLQVAFADPRFRGFLLSYYCGCRPAEAMECRGSDLIDRGEAHLLHIRGTKTDLSDRFVPVPDKLWDAIKKTPRRAFIASTSTGHAVDRDARRRIWNRLIREMNIAAGAKLYRNAIVEPVIADDLTPYCLRHDYCTRLAKAGVDIRTAQKLMGHSTIQLTATVYTHVDEDQILEAGRLINE